MCDLTPLRNWLIGCAALITCAVLTIVGAAVANGSWWYTYLSPIGMLVAAGFTLGAIGACSAAISALDTYCACIGARCSGQCGNLRRTLQAAMTVLGIQATACAVIAAYAWVPGAAQPAQWALIGALIIEAALIVSAIAFLSSLTSCAVPPATPTGSSSGGLTTPPGDTSGPTTAPIG